MAKAGNDNSVDRLRVMQIAEQKGSFKQSLHVVFNDDLMCVHGYFPLEKRMFCAICSFTF